MTEVNPSYIGNCRNDITNVLKVHHIDPKGHDSGVVYSEMQGRENTSGDLMALRFVDL